MSAAFFAASHDLLQRFLTNVVGPALIVLLLSIFIRAVTGGRARRPFPVVTAVPVQELLLAAGFACIPIVGIVGSRITHGPVIDRYFLSSVAGYAIFLGFANTREFLGDMAARALAACMVVLMLADLVATVYLTNKQIVMLIEPSSQLRLTTTPQSPMAMYGAIMEDHSGLDVLVPSQLEYLYFFMYAPPAVVRHLYFVAPTDNIFFGAYERLRSEGHLNLQITSFEPFLAQHNQFLFYESGPTNANGMRAIANGGYRLTAALSDISGTLYRYDK